MISARGIMNLLLETLFIIFFFNFCYVSAQSCSSFDTCLTCTEQPECGFCETSATCLEGALQGPSNGMNCTNWLFDSCPQVACEEYTNCKSCIADEFCGWCATTGLCMEGDEAALSGICPDWRQDEGIPCACGNEVIEPEEGEECDDGNTEEGDGCSNRCIIEYCGDGIVNNGDTEECDDGNDIDKDTCSNLCRLNCGNGRLDEGEECDDGNYDDEDSCTSKCTLNLCGNGRIDLSEECDDGNDNNEDSCSNKCLEIVCGNQRKDPGEECDDGNTFDGDFCTNECQINDNPEVCGNNIVDPDEECDNTTDSRCSPTCVKTFCGDGEINYSCTEFSSEDCEECDDGNTESRDGCSPLCKVEVLSDQFFAQVEDCGFNFGVLFFFQVEVSTFGESIFDCSLIFVEETVAGFGQDPTCSFRNSSYLTVFMGINPTIQLNSIIELYDNVFPTINSTNNRHQLFPPNAPISPIISILGPTQYNCQESETWDASPSYGTGGRDFTDWFWTVSPPIERLDENLLREFALDILIASFTSPPYNLTFQATNWLGQTSAVSTIIGPAPDTSLTVQIVGGSLISVSASKAISLTARVLNHCGVTLNQNVYFSWTRVSGPLVVLPAASSRTSQLYLPRGTLIGNSTYVLRVDVSTSILATPDIIGSDLVTLVTVDEGLLAVLEFGDRVISTSSELVLDASTSTDPFLIPGEMKYSWSCGASESGELCPVDNFMKSQKDSVVMIPSFNVQPGTYSFQVEVSKDTRKGVATNIVGFSFSLLPELTTRVLPQSSSILTTILTADKPILIEGLVFSTEFEIKNFSWSISSPLGEISLDNGNFGPKSNPDSTVPDTEFLNIGPGALAPGFEYTATLTAFDVQEYKGSASVSFYIGAKPIVFANPACSLDHTNGVSGELFTVICTGVETSETTLLPLLYDFLWSSSSSSPEGRVILGSTISPKASFTLPTVATSVIVRIRDAIGSSIQFDLPVTVSPRASKRGILAYEEAYAIYNTSLPDAIESGDMDLIYQLLTELLFQLQEDQDLENLDSRIQLRDDVAQIIQEEIVLFPTESNVEAQLYLLTLLVNPAEEVSAQTTEAVIEMIQDLLTESESNDVTWTDESWEYAYFIMSQLYLGEQETLEEMIASLLNDLTVYHVTTRQPSTQSQYEEAAFFLYVEQNKPTRFPTDLSDDTGSAQVTFSSSFKSQLENMESSVGLVFLTYREGFNPYPDGVEFQPNSLLSGVYIYHLSGSLISPLPEPFEITLSKISDASQEAACQVWSGSWTPECEVSNSEGATTTCSCEVSGDFSTSVGAANALTTTTTTGPGVLSEGEGPGGLLPTIFPTDISDSSDDYDSGVIGFTIVTVIIAFLFLGILARLRNTRQPTLSLDVKKTEGELGPILKDKAKKKAFDHDGVGLSPTDSSSGDEFRLRKPTRKGKIITFVDPDEESPSEGSQSSKTPSPSPSSSEGEGKSKPQRPVKRAVVSSKSDRASSDKADSNQGSSRSSHSSGHAERQDSGSRSASGSRSGSNNASRSGSGSGSGSRSGSGSGSRSGSGSGSGSRSGSGSGSGSGSD